MSLAVMRRAVVTGLTLFAASCWAVEFTTANWDLAPGKPFTLNWENAAGPVEIQLLTGLANELVTVAVIDAGDHGTSFTWTPPSTLPSGTYAFGINDGGEMNYSPQWEFQSSPNASPTSPTKPSTTTTPPAPPPPPPSTTATTTTPAPRTTTSDVTTPTTTPQTTSSPSPTPTTSTPTASGGSENTPSSSPTSTSNTSSSSSTSSSGSGSSSASSPRENTSPTPTSNPDSGSDTNPKSGETTQTPSPGGGGLSTGAKAGIGAGVGVVGLVLLGLIGLYIFRWGKAAGAARHQGGGGGGSSGSGGDYNAQTKAELGGDEVTFVAGKNSSSTSPVPVVRVQQEEQNVHYTAEPKAELGGDDVGFVAAQNNTSSPVSMTTPASVGHEQAQRAELWQGHHDEWRAIPVELDAGRGPSPYRGT